MPLAVPSWISHQPMVEPLESELPPPGLNDNAGDLDRLVRALKRRGFSPLQVHPSRINHLVRQIRQGRFKVTAVLGYHPSISIEDGITAFVQWYRQGKSPAA